MFICPRPAMVPRMTSRASSTLRPLASARVRASAVRALSEIPMKLLTTFTREPPPTSPQSMTWLPMHSSASRARALSCALPLARISSVPRCASMAERPTGESSMRMPRSARRCAISPCPAGRRRRLRAPPGYASRLAAWR
ncbi:Uncharacterised protein [Bordetella pertussis]|nr:Uncharacterised protein [Bordetella pertussis]